MIDPSDISGRPPSSAPVRGPVHAAAPPPATNKKNWITGAIIGCFVFALFVFLILVVLGLAGAYAWNHWNAADDSDGGGGGKASGVFSKVLIDFQTELPETLEDVGKDIVKGKITTRAEARDRIHNANAPVWKILDVQFSKASEKDGTITDKSIGEELIKAADDLRDHLAAKKGK